MLLKVVDEMKVEHERLDADLHAVIVPLPMQGHITPALQLARKLVALGFRISFVNTRHNHDLLLRARSKNSELAETEIKFVSISDGLTEGHRLQDAVTFFKGLLETGPAFERLFHDLLPITFIICDSRFTAVHHTAKKMRIPVAALVTSSAISTQCNFHLAALLASGLLPLPPPPRGSPPSLDPVTMALAPPRTDAEAAARNAPLTLVRGAAPSLRVEHLSPVLLTHDRGSFWHWMFLEMYNPLLPECECVVMNSFEGLEGKVLEAMRGAVNERVFAVGPLGLDGAEGTGLWEEDRECVSWLDGRGRGSVVYVSFGSIAAVSGEQMREFASGLEMSGCAVVWAVRADLMCGSEGVFSELLARARDRVLVVPWAAQTAVLAHPAVGAFLTHCGWNSILESVASGVPMLAWPRVADQNANCHYVADVWRIGMRFESEVRDGIVVVAKEEVAGKVRRILAAEGADVEVDAVRANSRRLQIAAREAVANGGSSHSAMTAFVELMAQHSSPPQQS